MNDIAIHVEGLGKRYRIGQLIEPYKTLREALTNVVTAPIKALRPTDSNSDSLTADSPYIWALKDVSFDVKEGEAVGIIGRNGAGKTTLLKILSRITTPTEGYAEIRGRVGSLLEVGTGFHPELTGRENVYLNGAVLGMKKKEIDRKFDEIVRFAEVEKFMDTPLKRYSTGMQVRLAFAVAAHLEPEILLVDEVLAVGDAAFQKKCLGKMGDVAREGRTVLFVSHNMGAVSNLCTRAILLEEGKIIYSGPTDDTIQYYLDKTISESTKISLRDRKDRTGNQKIILTDFYIEDASGRKMDLIQSGGSYSFVFEYETSKNQKFTNIDMGFAVRDMLNAPLFLCQNRMTPYDFGEVEGRGLFKCFIPKMPLAPGRYSLSAQVNVPEGIADHIDNIATVEVVEGDFFGTGENIRHSPIYVEHEWRKG